MYVICKCSYYILFVCEFHCSCLGIEDLQCDFILLRAELQL
jgi:hypothetical protein